MISVIDQQIKESIACVQQLKTNVDRIGQEFKNLRTKLVERLQTFKLPPVSTLTISKDFEVYSFINSHVLRIHKIPNVRYRQ
jgi:hypothetical protein